MVTAAKAVSQVATHMVIAFGITLAMTGSFVFGGLAAILEPVINVALLPFHHRAWEAWRQRTDARYARLVVTAQKVSQTILHMGVAFVVMYWATGSMVFGGLIAILEPICNVVALPYHDRLWEHVRNRMARRPARQMFAW